MTPETRLAVLLERLTYKPGWKFAMAPSLTSAGITAGMVVYMSRKEPDATQPEREITVAITRAFSYEELRQCSEERLVALIRYTLIDAEMHELNEWLKLDGNCVHEPTHELVAA